MNNINNVIKGDKWLISLMIIILFVILALGVGKPYQNITGKVLNTTDKISKNNEKYMVLSVEDQATKTRKDIFCFGKEFNKCDGLRYHHSYNFNVQKQKDILKLKHIN